MFKTRSELGQADLTNLSTFKLFTEFETPILNDFYCRGGIEAFSIMQLVKVRLKCQFLASLVILTIALANGQFRPQLINNRRFAFGN